MLKTFRTREEIMYGLANTGIGSLIMAIAGLASMAVGALLRRLGRR
jgi:LPXTG-motif cell wall-anchored protein